MVELHNYDLVIVNSSGGKDSICALWEICRMADDQGYSRDRIVVSHQDLGHVEWGGVKDLVLKQSEMFGLRTYFSKRRDKNGVEETLLDYVRRRKKWPDRKNRYCTSDFKRGPGGRVVTALTKELGECAVLYVFGFRKSESPARSKKIPFIQDMRLSTKKRRVDEYLPIHEWSNKQVWETIKQNNLPYHRAYDLGMPRLSCVFCVFSPFAALVVAGKENPELLDEYIEVEEEVEHTFRHNFSLKEVRDAIEAEYEVEVVEDWKM